MEPEDEPFTVDWMRQLATPAARRQGPIPYGDLATLMALFPKVEEIRDHIDAVARGNRPFIPWDLPTDVATAVKEIAEINAWAILNVVEDPSAELPGGAVPSERLRRAWNPDEATFAFRDD